MSGYIEYTHVGCWVSNVVASDGETHVARHRCVWAKRVDMPPGVADKVLADVVFEAVRPLVGVTVAESFATQTTRYVAYIETPDGVHHEADYVASFEALRDAAFDLDVCARTAATRGLARGLAESGVAGRVWQTRVRTDMQMMSPPFTPAPIVDDWAAPVDEPWTGLMFHNVPFELLDHYAGQDGQ